jgi:hypothetical protein
MRRWWQPARPWCVQPGYINRLIRPAKSVMAMTSIITPERTVDKGGKINVVAEDNAQVLLGACRRCAVACAVRL